MTTSVLPTLSPNSSQHHDKALFKRLKAQIDGAVRPMTVPENIKYRKKESDIYHQRVAIGRHPRSFPLHGSVWDCVTDAKQRLYKVQKGQAISRVVHTRYTPSPKKADQEENAEVKKDGHAKHNAHESGHKKLTNETRRRVKGVMKAVLVAEVFQDSLVTSMGISEEMKAARRRSQIAFRIFGNKLTKLHEKHHLAPDQALDSTTGSQEVKADTADINLNRVFKDSDFNSLRGAKIFYGSMVALEFISHHMWLTIDHSDADGAKKQRTISRKDSKNKSKMKRKEFHHVYARKSNQGGQLVFRIINLRNPQDNGPVNFGDDIWLSINEGSSHHNYKNGTVLGSRTKKALNLLEQDDDMRRTAKQMKENMGGCMPVPAMCNTRRDPREMGADTLNMNRKALAIGKWIVRRARVDGKRVKGEDDEENGKQLVNFSEIFLEQDWFHLSVQKSKTDPNSNKAWPAVMVHLPRHDEERPEGSDHIIDGSGVWKVHLVETADDAAGSSSSRYSKVNAEAERTERLLYSARVQLRDSQLTRDGSQLHEHGLTGGSKFTRQLRQKRQQYDMVKEEEFLNKDEKLNATLVAKVATEPQMTAAPKSRLNLKDTIGTLPLKKGKSQVFNTASISTSRSDVSTISIGSSRSRMSSERTKNRYRGNRRGNARRARESREAKERQLQLEEFKRHRDPSDMTGFERNHYVLIKTAQEAEVQMRQDATENEYSLNIIRADEKARLNPSCLAKLSAERESVEWWVHKDIEEFNRTKIELLKKRRQMRKRRDSGRERDVVTYRSDLHPSSGGRRPYSGSHRQHSGGRRQHSGGSRQHSGGSRQHSGSRRQHSGGSRSQDSGGRRHAPPTESTFI